MADFKIKKWSGSAWVDAHPETTVGQIVATGTPSSSTFLRGDGAWATPSDVDTNNYLTGVSGSGDGTVTFTRSGLSNLTWDASHSHSEYLLTTAKAADSQLLDGLDSSSFINNTHTVHNANDLAVGWYTIATNTGDRAIARFGLKDSDSGRHQSVVFYAAHHYGTNASNTLTVLHQSSYGTTPFRYIRIKDGGVYDGAALQVYIDNGANTVRAYLLGDNIQSSGWVLKDWIPDATDPGDVSNYSSFGERGKIDLDNIAQGGMATTGDIYAGGDTTQYRVLTTNDEDSFVAVTGDTMTGNLTISNSLPKIQFTDTDNDSDFHIANNNGVLEIADTSNQEERFSILSNGKVGIGTSSPTGKLEVVGDSGLIISADGTYNVGIKNNVGARLALTTSDSTNQVPRYEISGNSANAIHRWYQNSGTDVAMILDSNGNVGIGTASPGVKLQVQANTSSPAMYIGNSNAGGYSSISFRNQANTSNIAHIGFGNASAGNTTLQNKAFFGTIGANDAVITTSDTVRMTVASGGNVGIGTDSPTEKLTVYGDSNTSENSPVTFIKHNFTGTHGFGLSISRDNSDIAALALGSNSSNHGIVVANNTDLVLSTISSGVINSGMTVKTSGNVGIGTTSPETKLKVLDTVNYTSPTLGTNSGSFSVIKTDSAADQVGDYGLLMGISGSGWSWLQAQRVDGTATAYALNLQPSGGNVGIGTTSPSQKLEVNGNIRTSSGLLAGANLYLNDDNTATDTSIYFGDAASDTAHRLFFDDSAQEFNFSNSLSISGNVRPTGWVWASGNFHTNGSLYLNYDNTAANSYVFFGDAASDNAHYLQFSDATQKFTLTDDLIVTGDVTVNGSFTMVDTNTQTTEQWNVTNDGTGPAVTINQTGSQPVMRVQDDDTTVFEIVDGGNTQISNAKELTFLMNGQTYGSSLYVDSSDNTLLNARGGAGKTLTLRTYSGSAWNTGIVMDDAGNVGIGTTSPSYDLDVSGSIKASSNIISDGFIQVNDPSDSDYARYNHYGVEFNRSASYLRPTTNGTYNLNIGNNSQNLSWDTILLAADNKTIIPIGNVGIGTSNPSYKLDVSGNSFIDATSASATLTLGRYSGQPTIKAGTDDSGYLIMDSTGGKLGLNWYSSDDVSIGLGGGNVGIGTSTPGTKLDVNGNIQANTYYDRNDTNYYVNPASTSVLNVVDANRILSENVTTTPDEIGNIKIARLHESTTSTAIGSIDNLDTFILSKTDGGYGSGTKPSGSNNAFGVISLQTHTGNYFSQIGFESTGNNAYLRSASNSTSYSGWQKIFHDGYHPNADKLTTARTIAGVSFDGTANISLNNNAITNGAGYTTNTGTVTNVTGGTGVDVTNGTTTPSITLDLSEFTSMTDDINGLADELILLDGGAERRKTISSIKLSQFNNDAGWSSRRPVTAGGNSLASSESLDFIAGTGITISESGGDVTISASSSGEPEWEYVTKVSGANPLTYSGMDALSNYEYKFVVEVVTTAEDNSNPYIRINNDSTTGETSYQYTRVQQTTLTGETETHNGNANSNLIYTGLALSSYSNGGTSVSTVHNAEFIYTISPYSSSPGIYTGIVDGWGSTHYSSQSGTAYDGMVQSRFTGRKRSIYQTEANRIDYYHDITAGTTDYSEMRVYRRPKK